MDPLLAVLAVAALVTAVAALLVPSERGRPADARERQSLEDQLGAWM